MRIQFVISLIIFCLLLTFNGKAQLISISGFVKNASTGELKRNATVFESGSGIGTITSNKGYYRLLLSPGQQKLEVSIAGFHKYTNSFELLADTIISVELLPLEQTHEKTVAEKKLKPETYDARDSGETLSRGNK